MPGMPELECLECWNARNAWNAGMLECTRPVLNKKALIIWK